MTSPIVVELKDCSVLNFHVKSFYSNEDKLVYVFYRQGDSFTIDPANLESCLA